MSLFGDNLIFSDDPKVVFRKLRRVREAVVQGWKVGTLLRSGYFAITDAASAPLDYLLIVKSRQLNLCNGELLLQMLGQEKLMNRNPESSFGSPSIEQLVRLPPRNIFVLSIEEFEHLVGAIAAGDVDLPPLLEEAALKQRRPGGASIHF